ncbi:MAG TPA: carboxypeptidase regulatory-like domain-containing protein [Vicinamibacterales bacterium]|nr:carboxypeptidase regulatory-like domain-containing protein [Vicinamibacterales bacterium]
MRRTVLAIVAALTLASAAPLLGQQASAGMQGRVVDESGLALPGVTIVVTHEQSGMFRQVVSSADGTYYVPGVLPGPYRVVAELSGFSKFDRAIQLTVGNVAAIDITMKVGGLEETLTVTGQAPLVDTQTNQVGANIGQEELAALPISNRNWTMAVGLTPGVQVSQSSASFACDSLIVGGGSNRSGNFAVDGVGNNDDYLGSSCGSQVRPALEAVQEFQVLTNQYDAEFGRSAGAIINAITRQGGNAFHGVVFGSYTNDSVTSKDFFVRQASLQKPVSSQTDWGGTLGGPILHDRMHFFYSLDRIVYREGRSNTFAARPELNYSNTQTMKLWNHLIRVDGQINPNQTWNVRYLEEDSPTYDIVSGRVTLASRQQEFDIDRSGNGAYNVVFSNTRFNTLRVGYTYEKNGFTNKELQTDPPTAMVDLPPTLNMLTFTDGTTPGALFRIDSSYELSDTYSQFVPSWLGGSNDFKAGVQYVYSQVELPDQTDMNGRFAFRTDSPFDAANPSTYPERLFIRVPSPSDILLPMNVFVGFAQDKWQRGNVTLNLGIRYDLELTPIKPTLGLNPLFPNAGDYVVDRNNVAPRLGFAWKPGGSTTSVIRGGYGKFFDKVVLGTTATFLSQSIYTPSFTAAFPTSSADPGPSAGRLPTDPFLVNGPVVNRALLNSMFPPGSVGRNTGTVYIDNPDRVVPNLHQLTLGYEHQLGSQMAATIDYVHSWNRDQLVDFDVNPATRANTSRTGPITYTDLNGLASKLGISPFVNPVLSRQNIGQSQFDGLNLSVERRFSNYWAARVSYALGYARGDSEPNQQFTNNYQVLGNANLALNEGPLNNDRARNFVLSGRVEVPHTHGLIVSGIYRWMSGLPFTLINSNVDADRNGRLFDEIAPGHYCGAGANAYCVDYTGGRNGARGPSFQKTDLRTTYRLRPNTGTTVDLTFELFNIFNNWNFERPGAASGQNWFSDQRLTDFLTLTQFTGGNGQPRAAQFSARLGF